MTTTAERAAPTATTTSPDAAQNFRKVIGHLPTGVVIVAARSRDGLVGMAANSITSVSLQPQLVSVCAAFSSRTWPRIRAAGRFCISILADHHEQTSRRFAALETDRFAGVSWHDRLGGPALDDAVAWLDCELYAEYAAGDHSIAVARVLDLSAADEGRALVFFRGRYGRFVPNERDPERDLT